MVGLGRMGANLARRSMAAGHECVVFDVNSSAVESLVKQGATGASSLKDLVGKLKAPRNVWIMVPSGSATENAVRELAELLEHDDTIIDGGNSYYRDDLRRSDELKPKGVHYLDVGTSGGIWGFERGYCLMIGGDSEAVERMAPVFKAIAPGPDAASRTPGNKGDYSTAEEGYLHCGSVGAGHFVKMVHNGIEYGLMAAYAEGLNVLKSANVGSGKRDSDAETAPLEHPEFYLYDFNLAQVTEVWRRGSVISSWLLDLTAQALAESPGLEEYSGQVSDSGEGRWTSIAAIEEGVPAPVLTAALSSRFSSRNLGQFANQVLSAMRKQFGGHEEKKEKD
ncbi:MAG: decarboxylating 6-phosphogluconate dehydrogenase [Actinomycetota bacterium]|nr:MAG: decarboxylating 6-phosphogluconate dehydrogenase [Actinomycetota bacterium]